MIKNVFELRKVEKIIESVASMFKIDGYDFEDVVQIGRIAVWELSERLELNVENIDNYFGLINKHLKHVFISEAKRANAQKRIKLSKIQSLDISVTNNPDDDRILSDLIISNEFNPDELVTELNSDAINLLLLKIAKSSYKLKTAESKKAVIYLLVHILEIKREDIPKCVSYQTFRDCGIGHFLWIFFNNSPFRAINFAYPGEFAFYNYTKVPLRYWMGPHKNKRAIEAMRSVLSEVKYYQNHYPSLLTDKFFKEFHLACPLAKIFKNNRFKYLEAVFPCRYNAWEFSYTPRGYFNNENNIKKAVSWLVEEKLQIKLSTMARGEVWDRKITQLITKEIFCNNGLRAIIFRMSVEEAVRLTYPDKFFDWSFPSKTKWKGEKGLELARRATRWLLEEHLKINPNYAGYETFVKNGLHGLITSKSLGFNSSPKKVIKNAYK